MIYKKGITLLIFPVMLIILSHCISLHKVGAPSYGDVNPYNLPNDIGNLEKIVKNNPESSTRAKAHLQLALLYSSYNNPNPNYQKALKELEAYISLNPSGKVSEQIFSLHAILREMDKIIDENQRMKESIRQLDKIIDEYQRMKDSVKQLKNLDIEMEEKKKKLK